jgi:hypothetical protein
MNMTGEKLTRWFRIGVIGNWAVAGRHATDGNVARRFWDDMRTAFAEMDIIPKDLTRVNAKMDHLDPSSDAYKALGCRLNARQKDWDEACRRFKSAQAAFSAYVRVKSASIDRSENIREDLEARLQRIRERIDKLSQKTE